MWNVLWSYWWTSYRDLLLINISTNIWTKNDRFYRNNFFLLNFTKMFHILLNLLCHINQQTIMSVLPLLSNYRKWHNYCFRTKISILNFFWFAHFWGFLRTKMWFYIYLSMRICTHVCGKSSNHGMFKIKKIVKNYI